jgi:hypothetical protein
VSLISFLLKLILKDQLRCAFFGGKVTVLGFEKSDQLQGRRGSNYFIDHGGLLKMKGQLPAPLIARVSRRSD